MAEKSLDTVHPQAPGFIDKITPKKGETLFLFQCPKIILPEVPEILKDPELEKQYPENIEVDGPYRTAEPPAPTCGSIHYRHAGYVQILLPYMEPKGEKKMILENKQVMVCLKCFTCYVWDGTQIHDVTDRIDLKAWEKSEKEMHKATGPGGQC